MKPESSKFQVPSSKARAIALIEKLAEQRDRAGVQVARTVAQNNDERAYYAARAAECHADAAALREAARILTTETRADTEKKSDSVSP